MRVIPNSEATAVPAVVPRSAPAEPRLGQDQLAFTGTQSLDRSLAQSPEVRADKVAEAKALIQDGSYPPAVIIRKLSALLAISLDSQNNAD
jgi:hypothetical protein